MADLPPHRVALFDVAPRSLATIAGDRLTGRFRRRLERYRYGPGVFKIDVAIEGPIPWQAEGLDRAGTVHLGGTLEEIARSEAAVTADAIPSARSCCWPSRACSTRPARRQGATRCGRTATSRTVPRST